LEADVVALALESDVAKIEEAGLIQPGWQTENPNQSIVTKSVIAFVPRKADTKLATWPDLASQNLKVITANPKTSGIRCLRIRPFCQRMRGKPPMCSLSRGRAMY